MPKSMYPCNRQIINIIVFSCTFFCLQAFAATYYVSPTGDDAKDGSLANPLKEPQTALSKMKAGDTVYLRGGTYSLSTQVKTSVAGTASNPCKLLAYAGEKPVFDFTALNDRGLYVSKDYWHIRGIEVKNAGSNGICISGCGYLVLEGCISHDNKLEGIKLTRGAHDCLILNCDAYLNYDAANNGENADGFAAKSGVGTGNVFRGCRAWLNSDDGWDFYGLPSTVLIDSCFAFKNGFNIWGDAAFAGDGNAFKLGGASDTISNIVTHSVAFDNAHNGFDQNHSKAGQTIINCTGFRNGTSNFSFYETPTSGQQKKHILKNNVSYLGGAPNIDNTADLQANTWSSGITVSDADFLSIDSILAIAPRNPDYTLPANGFLRLSPNSQLIDKGVSAGLPFSGKAPDLGAFESGASTPAISSGVVANRKGFKCWFDSAPRLLRATLTLPDAAEVKVSLFDCKGRLVSGVTYLQGVAGINDIAVKTGSVASGIFLLKIQTESFSKEGRVVMP